MYPNHRYLERHTGLLLLAVLMSWVTPGFCAAPPEGPTLGLVVQDLPFHRLEELGIPYGVSIRSVAPAGRRPRRESSPAMSW